MGPDNTCTESCVTNSNKIHVKLLRGCAKLRNAAAYERNQEWCSRSKPTEFTESSIKFIGYNGLQLMDWAISMVVGYVYIDLNRHEESLHYHRLGLLLLLGYQN